MPNNYALVKSDTSLIDLIEIDIKNKNKMVKKCKIWEQVCKNLSERICCVPINGPITSYLHTAFGPFH